MGLAKIVEGLRKVVWEGGKERVWKERVHTTSKLRREEHHEKGNERLNGKR